MPDQSIKVTIVGLPELLRAFAQVDRELPEKMRAKLLGIAENVAGKAASMMPHKSGRMAGSVRASATSRGSMITAYGSRAPYGPFQDFGGSTGRGHAKGANMGAVHLPWMGKPQGMGRYLYPAVTAAKPQTLAAIDDAIEETVREAGFETTGGD